MDKRMSLLLRPKADHYPDMGLEVTCPALSKIGPGAGIFLLLIGYIRG
jgi:hypothetical protein